MKLSVPFMVVTLFAGILASAAGRTKPPVSPNAESEFRSLEARRFQAMVEADVPALENLLSDDLVYTHATGWRQNKAEFLASIRAGEIKYHSITSDNVKARVYGNTAVLTGTVTIKARTQGQELSVELLYLEIFVKQDGRWQLVAWQSTRHGS